MVSKKSIRFFMLSAMIFAACIVILFGCAESLSIRTAPPPLQVYDQPPCPGPGYLWVPGYWAYSASGYFWVPGMWELAPRAGWMWTPGYWSWSDGEYIWHQGYWARDIGFYGGIDYGNGYTGSGYEGGYWKDNDFYYNSAVSNASGSVANYTYNKPVVNKNTTTPAVSYNGGTGGVPAKPTNQELIAVHQPHIIPAAYQKRSPSTMSRVKKSVKEVNFKYKIDIRYSQMDQIKIQNYQVVNDTVKFFFCSGGTPGKSKYRFKQNVNILEIEEYFEPEPLQTHKISFCVFCTISGLKTGQYVIKTTAGDQQIDIK